MKVENIPSLYAQWLACQPRQSKTTPPFGDGFAFAPINFPHRFKGSTITYNEPLLLLVYGRATGGHELWEYEETKAHDTAFGHTRNLATSGRPSEILFNTPNKNVRCIEQKYLLW